MKKRIFGMILITLLVLCSSISYASVEIKGEVKGEINFSDLGMGHWAYNSVMEMISKGILEGYEDGTFRPDNSVTREQFAKVLVLSLDLPIENPSEPTFEDVSKLMWSYKYIETAKDYLTGYSRNGKLYYSGQDDAVREDMAVAIVFAKGLNNTEPDYTVIDAFKDKDKISVNLKKYIAIAVKNKIMEGYGDGYFGPQDTLTRAQACELMYKAGIIASTDDEKVVIGESILKAPAASKESGKYDGPIDVTFHMTIYQGQNPSIYYTLDGTEPCITDVLGIYKSAVRWDGKPIRIEKNTVLRAVAVLSGSGQNSKSKVSTYKYVIENKTTKELQPSPAINSLSVGEIGSITLEENPSTGYMWYYSIDNSDVISLDSDSKTPSPSGMVGASIKHTWNFKQIKTGSAQITFKYYRAWEGEQSATNTIKYIINNAVILEPPVVSAIAGTYKEPVKVTFTNKYSTTTKIYYTLDGKEPTVPPVSYPGGPMYMPPLNYTTKVWDGNPILIDKTTTLKAMAVDMGDTSVIITKPVVNKSEIVTFNYVIENKTTKELQPSPTINSLSVGEIGSITLEENPSTGYMWHYSIDNSDVISLDSDSKTSSPSGMVGASIKHTWNFKQIKTGSAQITFKYYRIWQGEQSATATQIYIINNQPSTVTIKQLIDNSKNFDDKEISIVLYYGARVGVSDSAAELITRSDCYLHDDTGTILLKYGWTIHNVWSELKKYDTINLSIDAEGKWTFKNVEVNYDRKGLPYLKIL